MSEIAGFADVLGVECERKRGFRHHSRDNSSSFTTSFSVQNPQRPLSPVTVRVSVFTQHKIVFALLSEKASWLLEEEWLAHKISEKSGKELE